MTLENELQQMMNPPRNSLKGRLGLSKTVVEVTTRIGFVWVRLSDNQNEFI